MQAMNCRICKAMRDNSPTFSAEPHPGLMCMHPDPAAVVINGDITVTVPNGQGGYYALIKTPAEAITPAATQNPPGVTHTIFYPAGR